MTATVTHLHALMRRRLRAGAPPPAEPSELPEWTNTVRELAHASHEAGYTEGERVGFVDGTRWGFFCGAACACLGAGIGLWCVLSMGLLRWTA